MIDLKDTIQLYVQARTLSLEPFADVRELNEQSKIVIENPRIGISPKSLEEYTKDIEILQKQIDRRKNAIEKIRQYGNILRREYNASNDAARKKFRADLCEICGRGTLCKPQPLVANDENKCNYSELYAEQHSDLRRYVMYAENEKQS